MRIWILAIVALACAVGLVATFWRGDYGGNVARQTAPDTAVDRAAAALPTEAALVDELAAAHGIEPTASHLRDFALMQMPSLRSESAFEDELAPGRHLVVALESVDAGTPPAQALENLNAALDRPMRESVWQVHLDQLRTNPDYLAQRRSLAAVTREDMIDNLVQSAEFRRMFVEDRLRLQICSLPEVQEQISAAIRRKGIPAHAIDKGVINHHCIIESREWYLAHARERGFRNGQFQDADLQLFASADSLRETERATR